MSAQTDMVEVAAGMLRQATVDGIVKDMRKMAKSLWEEGTAMNRDREALGNMVYGICVGISLALSRGPHSTGSLNEHAVDIEYFAATGQVH